jgi:hypothetical protein
MRAWILTATMLCGCNGSDMAKYGNYDRLISYPDAGITCVALESANSNNIAISCVKDAK